MIEFASDCGIAFRAFIKVMTQFQNFDAVRKRLHDWGVYVQMIYNAQKEYRRSACMRIKLALREVLPIPEYTHFIQFVVHNKIETETGLPTLEENEVLDEIIVDILNEGISTLKLIDAAVMKWSDRVFFLLCKKYSECGRDPSQTT